MPDLISFPWYMFGCEFRGDPECIRPTIRIRHRTKIHHKSTAPRIYQQRRLVSKINASYTISQQLIKRFKRNNRLSKLSRFSWVHYRLLASRSKMMSNLRDQRKMIKRKLKEVMESDQKELDEVEEELRKMEDDIGEDDDERGPEYDVFLMWMKRYDDLEERTWVLGENIATCKRALR